MIERSTINQFSVWEDCYAMKPKKRIVKAAAKAEIQRAWQLWDGEKDNNVSKLIFFGWLRKARPYFLTFRGQGDPWQQVHSWLLDLEIEGQRANKALNATARKRAAR